MAHKIRNAKPIQSKSRTHSVEPVSSHTFAVTSGASSSRYVVTLVGEGARCSCKWGQYRPAYPKGGLKGSGRSGCSHVVAVYDWLEARRGRTVSAWTDEEQASRQHRPAVGIGDGVILTTRKA